MSGIPPTLPPFPSETPPTHVPAISPEQMASALEELRAYERASITQSATTISGMKVVGELLLPGASLLTEGRYGSGAIAAAAGVVGGMLFGTVFGPLGYVLARYGTSAVAFYESLLPAAPAPPTPAPAQSPPAPTPPTPPAVTPQSLQRYIDLVNTTRGQPTTPTTPPTPQPTAPPTRGAFSWDAVNRLIEQLATNLEALPARLSAVERQRADLETLSRRVDALAQSVSPPSGGRSD